MRVCGLNYFYTKAKRSPLSVKKTGSFTAFFRISNMRKTVALRLRFYALAVAASSNRSVNQPIRDALLRILPRFLPYGLHEIIEVCGRDCLASPA